MSNFSELPRPSLQIIDKNLDDVQTENTKLKRRIRILEGEQLTIKAVLSQKIEILEAQIAGFQEREENMNRINKCIMEALEDLNNKDGKNEFTNKATEELQKASQQYTQAIMELKKRSKDDLEKFEAENKMLKEKMIEKDYELKALRLVIDEIKSGYFGVKDLIRNTVPSSEERRVLQSSDKVLLTTEDQKEKETLGRVSRVERDLEQIRETLREQTIRLSETTMESARSRSSVSAINTINTEPILLTRATSTTQPDIPSTTILRGVSNYERKSTFSGSTISGENYPLKHHYMNSESALSLRSELITKRTDHSNERYGVICEKEPMIFEGIATPQRTKENESVQRFKPSILYGTTEKITAQHHSNAKNQQHFSSNTYQTPNKKPEQKEIERSCNKRCPTEKSPGVNHKWQSDYGSKSLIPIIPLKRAESGLLCCNKENVDEPDFGKSISGFNTDRITVSTVSEFHDRLWERDRQDDSGLKTEIKYMIGRLLKVKNKLEKQGEQISMSRSPRKKNYCSPVREKGEHVSIKTPLKGNGCSENEKGNKNSKRVEKIPPWASDGDRLKKNRNIVKENVAAVSHFEYKTNYGRNY